MLDGDAKRFESGLNQTRAGLRLRLAFHESHIAVSQIERLRALGGPHAAKAIDTWRRAYVKACDHAAQAIDVLWNEHQWPSDGGRTRHYEWRPAKDFKR